MWYRRGGSLLRHGYGGWHLDRLDRSRRDMMDPHRRLWLYYWWWWWLPYLLSW